MVESIFSQENYTLAKTLLDATEMRHRALAGNLANLETPGYKRVDLATDFASELQSALKAGGSEAVGGVRPSLELDQSATAVRPDGNNVSLETEMLEINKNAMQYEFLTQYVSSSLKSLKTAITGQARP